MIVNFSSLAHLAKPCFDILCLLVDKGGNGFSLGMDQGRLFAQRLIHMGTQVLLPSSDFRIIGREEQVLRVDIVDELVHPGKEGVDPLVDPVFGTGDLFLPGFHGFVNRACSQPSDAPDD